MMFVRNYHGDKESISEILKDVARYADCADEVIITRLSHLIRVNIDVEDEDKFLKCAAKHVDSHTLEAWEHQVEEAREDADYSGPHGHEDR